MKWISIFESLPDDFKKVQVTYVTNNRVIHITMLLLFLTIKTVGKSKMQMVQYRNLHSML